MDSRVELIVTEKDEQLALQRERLRRGGAFEVRSIP
jgi:hypothetical protein